MKPLLLRGDARALPLPEASVDLIVTSPPYFGLRSYQDGGEHYAGQLGSEASPREFVDALIECTREMVRVLKPSGSIFVNLGDKYNWTGDRTWGVPEKSLAGIPWRYALRCVDELGLVHRAELVWSKPNGLPESVTDRVRRSHEQWFHFTVQPRYFAAVDEIREPHTWGRQVNPEWSAAREAREQSGTVRPRGNAMASVNPLGKLPGSVWEIATQPLKVPASLGVDHFAAFPMEWPRRLITGWCPTGACSDCGFLLGSSYDSGMLGVRKPLRAGRPQGSTEAVLLEDVRQSPHSEDSTHHEVPSPDDARLRGDLEAGSPNGAEVRVPDGAPLSDGGAPGTDARSERGRASQERDQDGQPAGEPGTAREGRARQAPEASAKSLPLPALRGADPDVRNSLACPNCGGNSFRPAVVADPFGGTGTTALVATMLGRTGISVDLSADYGRLAQWRCSDPKERARAAGTDPSKVTGEIAGQAALFDHEATA